MNSPLEKFVDFKQIMSDGLDRIVASKKQYTFFNSNKINQKNIIFFYLNKLSEYWDNFQTSYETKKVYGKYSEANPQESNYVAQTHVGQKLVFILVNFFQH